LADGIDQGISRDAREPLARRARAIGAASERGGFWLCDRRTCAASGSQADDHAACCECNQNGGYKNDPMQAPIQPRSVETAQTILRRRAEVDCPTS
jgi:hypothetical protein